MGNLQLLTVYLTLTPIFSGRKANIYLHTTPKLSVVMPISCLLRSIQFPSTQKDAITQGRSPCTCACFVCFQSSPAIKSFLELTDFCLVCPTFFCNSSLLSLIAQFLFAVVISFPFQAISTDDAFVTNVNE